MVKHKRNIYSFFDLLGDLGGVIEMFFIFFGTLIAPIAYHSYIMKAMQSLYVANTKN